jgi:hypothetical protein
LHPSFHHRKKEDIWWTSTDHPDRAITKAVELAQKQHSAVVVQIPSAEIGRDLEATHGLKLKRTLLTVCSSSGAIIAHSSFNPINSLNAFFV